MARTSPALVMGIIETDPAIVGPLGVNLGPFIDAASNMVTEVCVPGAIGTPDAGGGDNDDVNNPGYSDVTLELIERWLAAHYYAVRDFNNQVVAESAGDTSQTFQNIGPKMGLGATRWGQQAMALDYRGNLAALQMRLEKGVAPRPGVKFLGTRRRGLRGE